MEWQDISTAPKDGTEFIVFTQWLGDGHYNCPPFEAVQIATWDRSGLEYDRIGEATHWMPLPSPPKPITPKERD